jgi:nucleoside-diphosphate-sugar epimerase
MSLNSGGNECGRHTQAWNMDKKTPILVTGAAGFIGASVVGELLRRGFQDVRCGVRRSSDIGPLRAAISRDHAERCRIIDANLLSKDDCRSAVKDVSLIYHLVAGRGKSFPHCFQGSVVTTRNLLDAVVEQGRMRRFVNVSSFAVYSNYRLKRGTLWDESCPLEDKLDDRYDAYAYGKLKQDQLIVDYSRRWGVPYTIVRPGIVFGPGKTAIPGFVGLDTFGFFMHLGGGAPLPLTYVDNCAEAIVLAGIAEGAEGEVFNIVDDDLPTSRYFLRAYKRHVKRFPSVPLPYPAAYAMCAMWESYAKHSSGQLPPVFNRRMCAFAWKGHRYSNLKARRHLGWHPRVPMNEALHRYFEYQKNG